MAERRVNIPSRLKRWRKQKGFTLDQAAGALGLKVGTYIEYESGRRGKRMNDITYNSILQKTAVESTAK